jgi:hypothetical protein
MSDEPKSDIPAGTPEGYTKEEPSVDELGEPGTPGEGLSAEVPHAADAALVEHGDDPADPVEHHADTHMDAHTVLSDDDHGHAEATLGPVDWAGWAYAVVGAAAGLLVLYFFWVALG